MYVKISSCILHQHTRGRLISRNTYLFSIILRKTNLKFYAPVFVCSPKGEAYSRRFVHLVPCLANNFITTVCI